jgi:hypothetical protein
LSGSVRRCEARPTSAKAQADRVRDENIHGAREKTAKWHFINIELGSPDLRSACFGMPPIPDGTPASDGPSDDCIVDKINEFSGELATRSPLRRSG